MQIEDLKSLKGKTFAIDTETTGLQWYKHGCIGVSVYCKETGLNGYIPTCVYADLPVGKPVTRKVKEWRGEYERSVAKRKVKVWHYVEHTTQKTELTAVPDPERLAQIREILLDVASDPDSCFIFHNFKFDAHFLGINFLPFPCQIVDTSVMIHLFDSRAKKGMDEAERLYLGNSSKRNHVAEAPKKLAKKPWLWAPEVIADYAANDALVTYQLAEYFTPVIRKWKLVDLFRVQMEFSKILWEVERGGIDLDKDFCNYALDLLKGKIGLMERDLFDEVGYEFNPRSSAQLSKAIYEDMGIAKPVNPFIDPDTGKTLVYSAASKMYTKSATGSFLLAEKVKHPLAGLVLDTREASILSKTIQKWLELAETDGKLHASFRQTKTVTGRLSCSDPNLQNIASDHRKYRSEDVISPYSGGSERVGEYNLRSAIVAPPGYMLISADHKQQELRLFAVLANEPTMLDFIKRKVDIHLMIALEIWGDCGPELNKLHRGWSKVIAFGLLYGMGVDSIAFKLEKTMSEAEEILEMYFRTFPGIRPYLEAKEEQVAKSGLVRYWSGRLWRIDDPSDAYKGVNAEVQGGSADLIKLAMMRAQHVLPYQRWGRVVSLIHDELLAIVKTELVDQALPVLNSIMELEDVFGVPFSADLAYGSSYGSLVEVSIPLEPTDWRKYADPMLDMRKYSLTPWKSGR